MKIKLIGGPLDGKFHDHKGDYVPSKIQFPFMTDRTYVNLDGLIRREFSFINYERKARKNQFGQKEYVLVVIEDDGFKEWQKFEANPELVGAKWYGE